MNWLNNLTGKKDQQSTKKSDSGTAFESFPNGLAIILTIGAIGVIVTIVAIHIATVIEGQDTYTKVFETLSKKANDTQSTRDLFDSFQNYYKEVNASNTSLLSILLPVIGAWIGAILAFYYGHKNFEKLSDTFKAAASPEDEKLSKITVGEVLEKFPEYTKVNKAKITDQVKDSYEKIRDNSTNIVLTDANDLPLGILYKTDFTRDSNITEADMAKEEGDFSKFFSTYHIKDLILDKEWTVKGVDNYARTEKKDTLLEARVKLQAISVKPEMRGLVLDADSKIVGVVTYEMFSNVFREDTLEKI